MAVCSPSVFTGIPLTPFVSSVAEKGFMLTSSRFTASATRLSFFVSPSFISFNILVSIPEEFKKEAFPFEGVETEIKTLSPLPTVAGGSSSSKPGLSIPADLALFSSSIGIISMALSLLSATDDVCGDW
jgi:hypothetical protein